MTLQVVGPLWPELGIEARMSTTSVRRSVAAQLAALAEKHRVLVVRGFPQAVAAQLAVTRALGAPVGQRATWPAGSWLPELRIETDAHPNPYNELWHADTSWAVQPARFTLLYGQRVAAGCATTQLADASASLAALSPARVAEIAGWRAYHHVALARRHRHPEPEQPRRHARVESGRLAAFIDRLRWGAGARMLEGAEPPGVSHAVVRAASPDGRSAIFVGEHAWKLAHLGPGESRVALDQLTEEATTVRFEHTWQPQDLLVFSNESLLHRRGPHGQGARELRRTMAL